MQVQTSRAEAPDLSLVEVMRSRRSVRQYDPQFVIPREDLEDILTLAALAPSSHNLQHWRFLVIDDPKGKEKLLPIAFNQKQIVEASAVIAVLGDTEGYRKFGQIYGSAVQAGYMTEERANSIISQSYDLYANLPEDEAKRVVTIDASLAAMQLMLAAKAKGYDTVPMGGYDRQRFAEAFGIPQHYVPVMLVAIGKAAAPGRPTTRLPLEEVVFWNSLS
jgi:nitroreductase